MRQPILYAEEMWKRQRFWVGFLLVIGVAMSGYYLFYAHTAGHDLTTSIWLLYIPSGLLLGGALLFYRWRSRIEVDDEAVTIGNLMNTTRIDLDLVRQVRVQPLKAAFESSTRKKYSTPITRPYEEKPALFLRLRRDEPMTDYVVRRLGSRLAFEDTIAIPVPDPDAVAWEITSRLPEKTGVNQGGRHRRRRR